MRAISALFCATATMAVGASPALAGATAGTGGAEAGSPSAARHGASPAPKPVGHFAPVTASSPNLAYHGPVYEKTSSGAIVPYRPGAPASQLGSNTGGSAVGAIATTRPRLLVPGSMARYINGLAAVPMAAPAAVQAIIWAGNQIIGRPYVYGGGHESFNSYGYDCSGTVSYALHGAGLLSSPEDSSEFESWGGSGIGHWVSVFADPGHAYMTVAGLRLDTSAADDPSNQQGPRWRPLRSANDGYVVRHPRAL